jgi:hypothetical protein
VPEPKAQRNFTDPESRILKTKDGYIQGYKRRSQPTRRRRSSWRIRSQQWQRSGAVRSTARRHQGQPGKQSARSIGRCRLLLGCQSSHRQPAADQGLHRDENRRGSNADLWPVMRYICSSSSPQARPTPVTRKRRPHAG